MARRSISKLALLALLAGGLVLAPAASAAPATFAKISADGSTVLFSTTDQLVPSDTDTRTDVYLRTGATTSLISANLPVAGNGPFNAFYAGASADASHVFFATSERLVAADTDSSVDVYERFAGTTDLVSTSASAGNGPFPADLRAVADDGSRAIFSTDESLDPADTDTKADLYERSGDTTTLISSGTPGNAAIDVQFRAASADGSKVFFLTSESLVPGDTDSAADIYEHTGGSTILVSTGPFGGNAQTDVSFGATSNDGSIVYLETTERLVSTDTDSSQDVYKRSAGVTTQVSTSPSNQSFDATLAGLSGDGLHAYLLTAEALTPGDTDGIEDLYDHVGSTSTLISAGQINGNGPFVPQYSGSSSDGSHVFFTTDEPLVNVDTDASADLYQHFGGATSQVSVGDANQNGPSNVSFNSASADGTASLFSTADPLTPSDTDASIDLYQRSSGVTTLVSAAAPPASDDGPFDVGFVGATPDLGHVVFETGEHLTSDDTDVGADSDLFDRSGGTTTLISGGGTPSTAPDPPALTSTNPPSPSDELNPRVIGTAGSGTTVAIYSTSDCSGLPLATGTVAAFASPGIQISVAPESTTVLRATVTDDANNTSPCSSSFLVYRQGTTVAPPQLSATAPGSPGADPTPRVIGTAPAGTTIFVYLNDSCSGAVAASGSADELAGAGIATAVPLNSTTSLSATAANSFDTVSPCSNAISYAEDSAAPRAPALSDTSPASPANANTFSVSGAAEAGARVKLYRNASCQGSPVAVGTAADLAAGFAIGVADNSVTEIHATATDAVGNQSGCSSDSATYVEDSMAPKTRITFGPAAKTRDRTPTFRFTDTTLDATARFLCRVDRKPFRACSSPKTFKGLNRRRHTLRVKAVDGAGNHEAAATKRRFRIVRRR